ncbi:MAG: hypothetical protein JW757_08240 [Anaerolineales bacterium]|nr:hypothetical protein [Anaerolineales bacterium]
MISDLHLVHANNGVNSTLFSNKNLEHITYQRFVTRLVREAEVNQANHLDLVLAGDIFEMFKSPVWYQDEIRPYVHLSQIKPGVILEQRILEILDSIAEEEHAGATLDIFRNLQNYFNIPVKLHYLIGNHDRIVNATPATRRKARLLLGIGDDDSYIPHTHTFSPDGSPIALIRHGHEYDSANFSKKFNHNEHIPNSIAEEIYDAPSLGDFLALEFGNKLLYFFTQTYDRQEIENNKNLQNLYTRLANFDDVRPLTATMHYLLTTPNMTPRQVWRYLEPIMIETFEMMAKNRFFLQELGRYNPTESSLAGTILTLLKLRPWRSGIPLWVIQRISRLISQRAHLPESGNFAGREAALYQNGGSIKCVITGHTHTPEVSLINTRDGVERYHINTGTWRNVIPTSRDHEYFGSIKALAYAVLYGPGENPSKSSRPGEPDWSFDYWSGFSQKFYPKEVESKSCCL